MGLIPEATPHLSPRVCEELEEILGYARGALTSVPQSRVVFGPSRRDAHNT